VCGENKYRGWGAFCVWIWISPYFSLVQAQGR
jgi:hypothetical protein